MPVCCKYAAHRDSGPVIRQVISLQESLVSATAGLSFFISLLAKPLISPGSANPVSAGPVNHHMVQTQQHYSPHNHSPCPDSSSDPASVFQPWLPRNPLSLGHLLTNSLFNRHRAPSTWEEKKTIVKLICNPAPHCLIFYHISLPW